MSGHRHSMDGEHGFEPELGLPEPLPQGERLLWQGSPDWKTLALRGFHVRKLAIYFAVILAARAATIASTGGSVADAAIAALWLLPAVVLALGLITLMAWLCSRTTVYTVTDRRVVMRIGIVLSVTFNLPMRALESASVRLHANGCGDIPLTIAGEDRIAFVHLWPHARPWQFARPEPMLRCVPDAAQVAQRLSAAWAATTGLAAAAAPASPVTTGASGPAAWPAAVAVAPQRRNDRHGALVAQ